MPCVKVAAALATVLLTGCGSIHIGGETHTHIFGSSVVQTDEAEMGQADRILKTFKKMYAPDEESEPLEGFDWTEAGISEEDLTEEQTAAIGRDAQ